MRTTKRRGVGPSARAAWVPSRKRCSLLALWDKHLHSRILFSNFVIVLLFANQKINQFKKFPAWTSDECHGVSETEFWLNPSATLRSITMRHLIILHGKRADSTLFLGSHDLGYELHYYNKISPLIKKYINEKKEELCMHYFLRHIMKHG